MLTCAGAGFCALQPGPAEKGAPGEREGQGDSPSLPSQSGCVWGGYPAFLGGAKRKGVRCQFSSQAPPCGEVLWKSKFKYSGAAGLGNAEVCEGIARLWASATGLALRTRDLAWWGSWEPQDPQPLRV